MKKLDANKKKLLNVRFEQYVPDFQHLCLIVFKLYTADSSPIPHNYRDFNSISIIVYFPDF